MSSTRPTRGWSVSAPPRRVDIRSTVRVRIIRTRRELERGTPDRGSAAQRRRVPRVPARRPRGVDRRRAGGRRDRPPGVPQRGALGGWALRRHARSRAARRARLPGQRGPDDAPVLPPVLQLRRSAGLARGDRDVVADVVRVHGPHPGLQGVVHGQPGRRPRLVRAVRRQRAHVVPDLRRAGAVPQPRAGQSADRPRQGGARGGGRLRARRQGARRGHGGARRQDAGHRLGDHPRDVRGPEQRRRAGAGQGRGLCPVLHRADVLAGGQARLPGLL